MTPVQPPAGAVTAAYHERRERFGRTRDAVTRRWNMVANLRLVVVLSGVGLLIAALAQRALLPAVAGGAVLVGFVVLASYHGRLGRERRRLAELWRLNDEAIKRQARDWQSLPVRHGFRAAADHPYAVDLDLFGRASLFHLLETVSTLTGETALRGWLLRPAPAATVRERQVAVAELAPLVDQRDELALRGRLMGEPRPDPAPFLDWAEAAPVLAGKGALIWAGRLNLVLLWTLVIAHIAGAIAGPWWIGSVVANLILLQLLGGDVYRTLDQAWTHTGVFRHYAGMFELLSTATFQSAALRRIQRSLAAGGRPAHEHMDRLHRLSSLVLPRSAALYVIIQLFTLWDVQVLAVLERWQTRAGRFTRGWITALGEAEALAALATLAHDNPDWVFPTVEGGERGAGSGERGGGATLAARGLGHPLLAADARVTNDLQVGPAGTFLLVTGSNMSGKSTLLRAIGVNAVLAGTGGPVCATAFDAPPLSLFTSMRVQDSLERGVSYFMAELQRLKAVVDAGRAAVELNGAVATAAIASTDQVAANTPLLNGEGAVVVPSERPVFLYLLDEILQGTNTAERQIAARRIILHLVEIGAIGAVSTHDLTLAESPDLAAAARPVHFTEQFSEGTDGPTMSFDYHLRPGIATSTNALRLMQIVGLDV